MLTGVAGVHKTGRVQSSVRASSTLLTTPAYNFFHPSSFQALETVKAAYPSAVLVIKRGGPKHSQQTDSDSMAQSK